MSLSEVRQPESLVGKWLLNTNSMRHLEFCGQRLELLRSASWVFQLTEVERHVIVRAFELVHSAFHFEARLYKRRFRYVVELILRRPFWSCYILLLKQWLAWLSCPRHLIVRLDLLLFGLLDVFSDISVGEFFLLDHHVSVA